ncbi:MAG TPA: type III-B CRISPR module RAMP protein Cmr6 [Candidatus Obscuribacterales bacterium]
MRYPLPKDTSEILMTNAQVNRNLGLALDKFLPINDELDEEGNPWKKTEDAWKVTEKAKRRQKPLIGLSAPIPPIPTLIKNANARRTAMFKGLGGYHVEILTAFPDYRFVVGFGAEHVLETNLCLHRVYGFPIIPGSAVKGVTRAWALLGENLAEDADLLIRVFGNTNQQGQVIFFDAYPTQAPTLKLDILNPHYGEYYQGRGGNPPADYLSPVPTYFLTVVKGSPFQFAVASKDNTLAGTAKGWLQKALSDLGIGGKTATGYGYFTVMK